MTDDVVAAVVHNGDLIAVCADGTSWRLVIHTDGNRWERVVRPIEDFR